MRRGGLNIPTFMQIPPCKLMARLIDQSMAANLTACTYTTLKVADNESEHNEYGIWKADVVSPKCSLALMKISTTMSKDSIGQRTIPMWTTSARSHRLSLSARCGANNNMWIWAVCCRHYRLERLLLLIVAVDYRCRFFCYWLLPRRLFVLSTFTVDLCRRVFALLERRNLMLPSKWGWSSAVWIMDTV